MVSGPATRFISACWFVPKDLRTCETFAKGKQQGWLPGSWLSSQQETTRGMKRRKTFLLVIPLVAFFALVGAVAAVWWNDPMATVYAARYKIGWTTLRSPATGPLKVQPPDRRYFTDGSGKAIYLTGSHTWNNLQDRTDTSQPEFGYAGYLRLLGRENHNFMRLWVWEQAAWAPWTTGVVKFHPLPYLGTGPGTALYGG